MKSRVSDQALEALLREGDPAHPPREVTITERAVLQAQLAMLPIESTRSLWRPAGVIATVSLLVSATALAIFWPHHEIIPIAEITSPISARPIVASARPVVASARPVAASARPIVSIIVTHVVIVADSTCRPDETTPMPEKVVIHGDANSIVVTTEPQTEKEVSL